MKRRGGAHRPAFPRIIGPAERPLRKSIAFDGSRERTGVVNKNDLGVPGGVGDFGGALCSVEL